MTVLISTLCTTISPLFIIYFIRPIFNLICYYSPSSLVSNTTHPTQHITLQQTNGTSVTIVWTKPHPFFDLRAVFYYFLFLLPSYLIIMILPLSQHHDHQLHHYPHHFSNTFTFDQCLAEGSVLSSLSSLLALSLSLSFSLFSMILLFIFYFFYIIFYTLYLFNFKQLIVACITYNRTHLYHSLYIQNTHKTHTQLVLLLQLVKEEKETD